MQTSWNIDEKELTQFTSECDETTRDLGLGPFSCDQLVDTVSSDASPLSKRHKARPSKPLPRRNRRNPARTPPAASFEASTSSSSSTSSGQSNGPRIRETPLFMLAPPAKRQCQGYIHPDLSAHRPANANNDDNDGIPFDIILQREPPCPRLVGDPSVSLEQLEEAISDGHLMRHQSFYIGLSSSSGFMEEFLEESVDDEGFDLSWSYLMSTAPREQQLRQRKVVDDIPVDPFPSSTAMSVLKRLNKEPLTEEEKELYFDYRNKHRGLFRLA